MSCYCHRPFCSRKISKNFEVITVHALKACRRSRGIIPLLLKLEKSPLFPLNEQLWAPESLWIFWRRNTFHVPARN